MEKTKKKVSGKTIFNFSVIVISLIVLMVFALSENGINELINNLSTMDVGWIIVAVLCNVVNIFIDALLTYIFIRSSNKEFHFAPALKCCLIGQFFSAVTPFSTGGQPMQIYYLSKKNVSPGVSTAALVHKFIVYQTCLTTYSLFSLLLLFNFFGQNMNGVILSFTLFGFATQSFVIFLLLLFSFNKKLTHALIVGSAKLLSKIPIFRKISDSIIGLEDQLASFHKSNKELFKDKKLLIKSYFLTTVQLTSIFIIPYCIYRAFNQVGANPIDMICSQAFVTMTSCFIPLPGAAGASELSFMGFFANYFSDYTLKSAVLLWRIITYYGVILITAPFSRLKQSENKSSTEDQSTELPAPDDSN